MVEITVKRRRMKKQYTVTSKRKVDAPEIKKPKLSLKNKLSTPDKIEGGDNQPTPSSEKNLKQKQKRRGIRPPVLLKDYLEQLAYACECFPEIFTPQNPSPLSIGFLKEIRKDMPSDMSNESIRMAIVAYTQLPQYLRALEAGKMRVNPKGEETQPPTPHHMAYASSQLAQWEKTRSEWSNAYKRIARKFPNLFCSD